MNSLNWLILAAQVANLAFTMKSAAFMVDMTENFDKKFKFLRNRLQEVADELESNRPLPAPSNTRLQESGLIEIDQAQTYDPRFTEDQS